MPPEPTIVPPTPTVTQPSGPVDNSPGIEMVQRAFDKAYPDRSPKKEPEPVAAAVAPETPQPPPGEPAPIPEPEPLPTEIKVPNFLEEALRVEVAPGASEEPKEEEDWPEELPSFKSSEEAKARYKNWRESYNRIKREAATRINGPDEATTHKLHTLETQNQEMQKVLSRMGVEQHADFQRGVIAPMQHAWQSAASIIKDAGGDPSELARAVQYQGKKHFEALDEVFEGLPESAKLEAHQAIATYKRYDEVRRKALAEAPKTFQELHRKDLERQYEALNQQRADMKKMFAEAGRKLREVAKVEILQKSDEPDAAWWNKQADEIQQNAENLYLENTDMEKMAYATWLAPMADVYRKLWLSERIAHQKTAKNLKEHFGAEPYIGEGGGGSNNTPGAQMEADMKQPFSKVFLREFHKAQAKNR